MKKYLLTIIIFSLTFQIKAQTISDADGNTYNTVTIGTQVWMKENLKTTKFNDGTAIPNVTTSAEWIALTTPAYCWNQNNISNKTIYGALYNWHTVNTSKLCPSGWHVPTDSEWTTLENYLIANGYNYDGSTRGNKIAKALASSTNWNADNGIGSVGNTDYPAKRNATGFSAMPGGCVFYNGNFDRVGGFAGWWSSTEYNSTNSYFRFMSYNRDCTFRYYEYHEAFKIYGYSVRCIKDSTVTSAPTLGNQASNFLYPNPATDKLYFNNNKLHDALVVIFDLQGSQVVSKRIDSNTLDISRLSKGIYVVKIIDSENSIMEKFIKK